MREKARKLPAEPQSIAIIGSGLAALSTAIFCEQAGYAVDLFERDNYLGSRSEGYGLTLKYDPRGILAQLGVLEDVCDADCPSRSHYLLRHDGVVLGYFGNAFSSDNRGWGQRGNLRVPRQKLRTMLIDKLQDSKIHWGHELVAMKKQSDGMELTFANGKIFKADWVIGADGINSKVVRCILPDTSPPRPLGVHLTLGLTEPSSDVIDPSLLHERGFYTLKPGHRLFVMPYSSPDAIDQTRPVRYMWQLTVNSNQRERKAQQEALDEAYAICKDWHRPVPQLIQSTPPTSVWSSPLFDRDPNDLYESFLKLHVRNQEHPTPVLLVGDALHAMSCFKGQGAHQALLDGRCVAKWLFAQASTKGKLQSCWRELVQRSAPIVQDSRRAAVEWHEESIVDNGGHSLAGCSNSSMLLAELEGQNIRAGNVDDLDKAVGQVKLQVDKLSDKRLDSDADQALSPPVPTEWCNDVWIAIRKSDLLTLRELSWKAKDCRWMQCLIDDDGCTCLHVAAAHDTKGAVVQWLVREAGCSLRLRNDRGELPIDWAVEETTRLVIKRLNEEALGQTVCTKQ
jgi:2-polyprenyl-6-methoxyphenol hydroxylase-like FAD-dependent oxidoreductase